MVGRAAIRLREAVGRKVLVPAFTCVVVLAAALGCSEPTTSSAPPASAPTTLARVPATADPADTVQLFADIAAEMAPLAVFAPSFLPEGALLAASWAPVIDSTDPDSYNGPPRSNPYVVGSGADAETQVVYGVGDGWLVIIENYRGDLGDVAGENVGTVEDSPATLFSVNGGELVQWSKNGCWYGVFGRGLGRDVTLAAALGMKVTR